MTKQQVSKTNRDHVDLGEFAVFAYCLVGALAIAAIIIDSILV